MSPEALFSLANMTAHLSWLALILLPWRSTVVATLRWGPILALSLLYATLIAVFLFRAEGGFFSLAGVQALFASPWVALAGWVHYLAFVLFVGIWIARRADALGLSRIIQAPLLLATFMFGPLGYLLFHAILALPGQGRLAGAPA